jgi:acyl-CoA synthetase (AMP-forming)/AMP-acid ligase II
VGAEAAKAEAQEQQQAQTPSGVSIVARIADRAREEPEAAAYVHVGQDGTERAVGWPELEWILQGAAPMPPSLVHRWAHLIGPERIVMAYGMTEAIGITALDGTEWLAHEEVEAALIDHPKIADVVVVGLRDPEWGRRVHAIVESTDPAAPPSADEVIAYAKERLAAYEVPKTVELVDAIPRSEATKVNRGRLVEARGG